MKTLVNSGRRPTQNVNLSLGRGETDGISNKNKFVLPLFSMHSTFFLSLLCCCCYCCCCCSCLSKLEFFGLSLQFGLETFCCSLFSLQVRKGSSLGTRLGGWEVSLIRPLSSFLSLLSWYMHTHTHTHTHTAHPRIHAHARAHTRKTLFPAADKCKHSSAHPLTSKHTLSLLFSSPTHAFVMTYAHTSKQTHIIICFFFRSNTHVHQLHTWTQAWHTYPHAYTFSDMEFI